MAGDVYWIKLHTSTFDAESIILLESMPDGETILIIWIKMQILAGKCNSGGYLLMNGESPYSDEMLATVFRRPLNTVRLAISAFLSFGMVEVVDGVYFLSEWEKTQNVASLERIKEQNRKRVERHRSKQKGDVTLHVTQCNALETEVEKEIKNQQQEVRERLSKTPFSRISDTELRILANQHGYQQLFLAADIAAQTWWRENKEIPNPGGYLQALCSKLIILKTAVG